jgi:hypothetical protein
MSPPMRTTPHTAVFLTLAALLNACGQSSQDPTATHAIHVKKVPSQADRAGSGIDPDMVSAVSAAGNSTTPISMRFRLADRPAVRAPLQVTLLLIPSTGVVINHIHVSFQSSDGLQLQSDRNLDLTDITPGTPIQQDLTVVPQQTGVLTLTATVLVDSDTQSISRTYSIPLIVTDNRS